MPLESFYFNLTTLQWVISFDEPSNVDPPVFGYGDARDFGVTFLKTTGSGRVAVLQSVVAAQIALSSPSAPGTLLTNATASGASNNEFPFVLNVSGANMAAFISGALKPLATLVEFRVTTALGVNRYGSTIYVRPQQIADVTADPPAGDRALGAAEAAGVFIPKEVPAGTRMIWTDEITGQVYNVGFANGQFQANLA